MDPQIRTLYPMYRSAWLRRRAGTWVPPVGEEHLYRASDLYITLFAGGVRIFAKKTQDARYWVAKAVDPKQLSVAWGRAHRSRRAAAYDAVERLSALLISKSARVDQCDKTDPYGALEYVVGSGDDFICFDFVIDETASRVKLHAVLNSETGSFIQDFAEPEWVDFEHAVERAVALTAEALDWCLENRVRLDLKGWNQDPTYFARSVCAAVRSEHPHRRVTRRVRRWRERLFARGDPSQQCAINRERISL